MTEKIRLKGRSLLIGAVPLSCLSVSVLIMMIVALSLLPLVYINLLLPYLNSTLPKYSKYISAIVAVLISLLIYIFVSSLKTGCNRYMLKKAQGIHADTKDIFFYFKGKSFFSLAFFSFRLFWVKALIFTLFNIPSILCLALLLAFSTHAFSAAVSLILAIGFAAFTLNGVRFYKKLTSTLFLAEYYFIKGEYINFRHLLSSSQSAMKGKSAELLRLKGSFLGWIFSCAFILPIGYVWGYYNQTLAAYANEIMKLQ